MHVCERKCSFSTTLKNMATLKLTIDKRRKYEDGRKPLIIRLTSEGKSTSIHLGIKLFEQEWDFKKQRVFKKHPNQTALNLHLKNIQLQYELKIIEITANNSKLEVVELKRILLEGDDSKDSSFHQFASMQIENLQIQGRYGNAQSYITARNRFIEFTSKNLKLSEIDFQLIIDFDASLASNGVGVNGIAAYMRAIRALLNKAGKLGLYDMNLYPYNHYKIRTEKTLSRAESIETIIELSKLNLQNGSDKYNSRNIFLLIFSLIGISFMDLVLLKKSNVKDGRINYKRAKTGKLYSIKLTPLSIEILEHYKSDSSEFLLPQFGLDGIEKSKVREKVQLGLKSTNRYLKQLGKELELGQSLTTYVARYSWANIAKSRGYSKDLIAEALGHSYGNAVTGIYLEGYGNEVIDLANETLVGLLDY